MLHAMTSEILAGIKTVIFDFWYTIARYETEAEWARQDDIRVKEFCEILTGLGYPAEKEKIANTLQQVGMECEQERVRTEIEVSSRQVVMRFLTRLGIRKQVAGGIERLVKSFDESLLAVSIVAEPGALEVLAELKQRGYPLALLSNTSHGHVIKRIMDREGLSTFFDHLFYTDQMGPRKPSPEAFKIVLDALGTEHAETAHVGDRLELDVLGARRSGIRSVLYASNSDICYDGYPRPDFCIHDLRELITEE